MCGNKAVSMGMLPACDVTNDRVLGSAKEDIEHARDLERGLGLDHRAGEKPDCFTRIRENISLCWLSAAEFLMQ